MRLLMRARNVLTDLVSPVTLEPPEICLLGVIMSLLISEVRENYLLLRLKHAYSTDRPVGRGKTNRIRCVPLFQQEPVNPRRRHRPNKETNTSLNSVVPNRISVAPGSTSMRPALCAT